MIFTSCLTTPAARKSGNPSASNGTPVTGCFFPARCILRIRGSPGGGFVNVFVTVVVVGFVAVDVGGPRSDTAGVVDCEFGLAGVSVGLAGAAGGVGAGCDAGLAGCVGACCWAGFSIGGASQGSPSRRSCQEIVLVPIQHLHPVKLKALAVICTFASHAHACFAKSWSRWGGFAGGFTTLFWPKGQKRQRRRLRPPIPPAQRELHASPLI